MKPINVEASAAGSRSHLQILKSTALIGGSSVVNILFAIIRNKAIALLLGPQGTGLFGLFGAILDLAQTFAGIGVQPSGVRQIAEAVGTGDKENIARTAAVVARLSIVLGAVGAVAVLVASPWVAEFTFGNRDNAS